MRSGIKQLIVGTAVAVGLSAVCVSAIGSAVAQSEAEQGQGIAREVLTNRYEASVSETDFGLGDRQQLKRYFFK
jgi:hypothetical protein